MALPGNPSSIADYGLPPAGFVDYLVAAVDPTTDQPAAAYNQSAADVASMTQTPVKAWAVVALAGAGAPTLVSHNAMWGNAPGVAPTVARSSAGVWTVTWAATQTDPLAVVRTLNFTMAHGGFDGAALPGLVNVSKTGPNVVTIYGFGFTGTAATDLTGNVKVFVY
ncbi:MAG: hypothetical protein NVS3B10_30310 [Polyangiales bacterium]